MGFFYTGVITDEVLVCYCVIVLIHSLSLSLCIARVSFTTWSHPTAMDLHSWVASWVNQCQIALIPAFEFHSCKPSRLGGVEFVCSILLTICGFQSVSNHIVNKITSCYFHSVFYRSNDCKISYPERACLWCHTCSALCMCVSITQPTTVTTAYIWCQMTFNW